MRYLGERVVFQEIPEEISLSLQITGCSLRCSGCHSPELWNSEAGILLTEEVLAQILTRYQDTITNVLFMGGEWEKETLLRCADLVRRQQLKVGLYTGLTLEQVPAEFWEAFDFLKVGPYLKEQGGLQSLNTNQRLYETKTRKVLNHYFTSKEDAHGQTQRTANF